MWAPSRIPSKIHVKTPIPHGTKSAGRSRVHVWNDKRGRRSYASAVKFVGLSAQSRKRSRCLLSSDSILRRYQLVLSLAHPSTPHALPQRPLLRTLTQPFLARVWAAPKGFELSCLYNLTLSHPPYCESLRTLQLTALPGISNVCGISPTTALVLVARPRSTDLHLARNCCSGVPVISRINCGPSDVSACSIDSTAATSGLATFSVPAISGAMLDLWTHPSFPISPYMMTLTHTPSRLSSLNLRPSSTVNRISAAKLGASYTSTPSSRAVSMSPGVAFAADEIDITKATRNIHNGCFIGFADKSQVTQFSWRCYRNCVVVGKVFRLRLPGSSIFVGWRCPEAYSAPFLAIQTHFSRYFHHAPDFLGRRRGGS